MGLLAIFKSNKLSTPSQRQISNGVKHGTPPNGNGFPHNISTCKSASAVSSMHVSSRSSMERMSSEGSPRLSHDELDKLCELILRIGSLIHQLQKERGVSAICVGRERSADDGTDSSMHHTLNMLKLQTDKSFEELKQIPRWPRNEHVNASKIASLRESVRTSSETYVGIVKSFGEMINVLISVVSKTLDVLKGHSVGQSVAAYLAFMHLKESMGVERALICGILSSTSEDKCLPQVYAELVLNLGHQQAYAQAFCIMAPKLILEAFEAHLQSSDEMKHILDRLHAYKMAGKPDNLHQVIPDLTYRKWFDLMTERIDKKLILERMLANNILEHGTKNLCLRDGLQLLDESKLATSAAYAAMGLSKDFQIDVRELDVQREIGRGTTGSTYLARWRGTRCAVKVVQVQKEGPEASLLMRDFTREVEVLTKARHPNICQFLGAAIDPPTYCVVLEYMDHGSLYDILRKGKELNFFDIAKSVACGMEYLHCHCNMMHRDMKSPNLLLDEHGRVKIADFGLTCLDNAGEKTAEIGTYRWMAPEVICHEPYGLPADVYSYGMVLFELYTRELPFSGLSPMKVAMSVATKGTRPELPADTPAAVRSLITACWAQRPQTRPTFRDILPTLDRIQAQLTDAERATLEGRKLLSNMRSFTDKRTSRDGEAGDV